MKNHDMGKKGGGLSSNSHLWFVRFAVLPSQVCHDGGVDRILTSSSTVVKLKHKERSVRERSVKVVSPPSPVEAWVA